MNYKFQLAKKYLFTGLPITTILSVVGMAIGVGSLVVSMAVFSGFEKTLTKTVVEIAGHLLLVTRGEKDQGAGLERAKKYLPEVKGETPFLFLEAVLAEKGEVSGVAIEGIDPSTIGDVLRLEKRVKKGRFDFSANVDGYPGILVGQALAKRFRLKVGDVVRLVVPLPGATADESFRPRLRKFAVNGILAFGHFEYDSRSILMSLFEAQNFSGQLDRVTGYKLKLASNEEALQASLKISNEAGNRFFVKDWRDGNRNLFEAIGLEKALIFFVLQIIVIAASFNIAGTLFISVIRRFKDISVLKSMGASSGSILKIFTMQGMGLGLLGTILGFGLGFLASFGFILIQENFGVFDSEVYKLDKIELSFQWLDFLTIFLVSMTICFISTILPARRGARLNPVEGMRYE